MLATSNIYAHLQRPRPRSENPGVGGSIPSQPTIVFSPACRDLARAARTRRARCARLTRTVLELTRVVRVAVVSGMTGAAGARRDRFHAVVAGASGASLSNTPCGFSALRSGRGPSKGRRRRPVRSWQPAGTSCYATEPDGFVERHRSRLVLGLDPTQTDEQRTSNPGRASESLSPRVRIRLCREGCSEDPRTSPSDRYRPITATLLCGQMQIKRSVSPVGSHHGSANWRRTPCELPPGVSCMLLTN